MAEAVEQLVDDVLDAVPKPLREACDRDGILAGLDRVGACSVPMLRTLLEQDYADVKAEIGGAAKPAFVATLKVAVLKAADTAEPTTLQNNIYKLSRFPSGRSVRPRFYRIRRIRQDNPYKALPLLRRVSRSCRTLGVGPRSSTNERRLSSVAPI